MRIWIFLLLGITAVFQGQSQLGAEELAVDLAVPDSAKNWLMLDRSARIEDGQLVLDGRQKISRAVYLPHQWGDAVLTAKFLVEPQAEGVLAC